MKAPRHCPPHAPTLPWNKLFGLLRYPNQACTPEVPDLKTRRAEKPSFLEPGQLVTRAPVVAATYKPPMLVPRVRLSAGAFGQCCCSAGAHVSHPTTRIVSGLGSASRRTFERPRAWCIWPAAQDTACAVRPGSTCFLFFLLRSHAWPVRASGLMDTALLVIASR